jgi:hypothetical protein
VVALAVVLGSRGYFGEEVFNAWAWRVPFPVSFLLVAIAIYIRPPIDAGDPPQQHLAAGRSRVFPR